MESWAVQAPRAGVLRPPQVPLDEKAPAPAVAFRRSALAIGRRRLFLSQSIVRTDQPRNQSRAAWPFGRGRAAVLRILLGSEEVSSQVSLSLGSVFQISGSGRPVALLNPNPRMRRLLLRQTRVPC
jgi:hypothetical protein